MKRASPLVSYGSSDEDVDDAKHGDAVEAKEVPPPKKRKLPLLSSTFMPTGPADNPALHQGRVRTTPHVEGQYAAYVYVPIQLERYSKLLALLRDIYLRAKELAPTLHPIGLSVVQDQDTANDPVGHKAELHVSLSRPIYLRAHQRDELKRAVSSIARARQPFDASFATFAELENDERTRSFVTLEIGAGHTQLTEMTTALLPTLQLIRQKEFYSEPRFHASIAWALLTTASKSRLGQSPGVTQQESPGSGSASPLSLETLAPGPGAANQFATIDRMPIQLINNLKTQFSSALVDTATFNVDSICVRIGKDVSRWRLGSV